MHKLFCALICLCLFTDLAIAAPDAARIHRIERAWGTWVAHNKIKASSIAIAFNGKIIATTGKNRSATDPAALASLSKAITAVCIAKLFEEHSLPLTTSLGDLTETLRGGGLAYPPQARDITVAQLITHASGMNPDITQGTFNRNRNASAPRDAGYAYAALKNKARSGASGKHFYNNGNYATLGAIIAAVSGQSAETTCKRLIFTPLGLKSARLSTEWKALGAFGGWEMSAEDYLRFGWAAFAPTTPWGAQPSDFPNVTLSHGRSYGMGIYQRPTRGGHNFWHFGRICTAGRFTDRGAYFVRFASGWSFSVNYDFCPEGGIGGELDRALYEAAHN